MFGMSSGLGPPTQAEIDERTEYTVAIQDFAQRLVNDPVVNSVLRRVGIGGELSHAATNDINARFGLDKHFVFKHANFFSFDQQAVILSLARRVVAGQFPDATCEDAFAYVFERVFAFQGDVEWQTRIKDVRVTFDEFYQVLRDYHAWETETGIVDQLLAEIKGRQKKYDDMNEPYNEDDLASEVFEPVKDENRRIFRKYGLINNADVRMFTSILRRENRSIDDVEYIRAQASRLTIYSYIQQEE